MPLGLHHFADKDPDAIAIVDPAGREWTRGEITTLINRISRAFLASGLGAGDVVAIVSPNCAEYIAFHFAGLQTGLLTVPINWHLADPEIAFVLGDSEARVVVCHPDLGERMLTSIAAMVPAGTQLLSIGDAPGYVPLGQYIDGFTGEALAATSPGGLMPYTSATTGKPKAVKVPPPADDQEVLEHIARANASLGIHPEAGNVHLCASMLYHSAPLGGVQVALALGHKVVLTGMWQPELLLQLIERYRVTTTFMVPTMFIRLLKLPDETRTRYSTASLRFLLHGGAPCPPDVKRQMIEWLGDVVWEAYGATEVSGTVASAQEWLKYPGTVGRPFPGSQVKIFDEHGNELPPGKVGLVYLIGLANVRFSYKGDPEKTRRSYIGDFITAGDLGYLNEEGYLFLCDRSADLIISSGMNIYPAEIETILVQHPAVVDCAVLPEPHALLGEIPKAFVQVEPGFQAGPALNAELLRYLGERLAAAKLPKRFEYVEQIPRDPSGKLFKRLLRKPTAAASGTS